MRKISQRIEFDGIPVYDLEIDPHRFDTDERRFIASTLRKVADRLDPDTDT